jgi:hypothetical protein
LYPFFKCGLLCAAAVCAVAVLAGAEHEGFAVNALVHGGVLFVGADHNSFESTVIAGMSVVCALGHGAGNGMVGLFDLFHFGYRPLRNFIRRDIFLLHHRGDGYSIAPFSAFIPELLTFSLRNDIIFSENKNFPKLSFVSFHYGSA